MEAHRERNGKKERRKRREKNRKRRRMTKQTYINIFDKNACDFEHVNAANNNNNNEINK